MIETERLILRPWEERDRESYAALNTDPEVMHDYPVLPERVWVDAKFDRYTEHFSDHGFGRWMLERKSDGAVLGYTGIMPMRLGHPFEEGMEIGWRLARAAWGHGYASEAARAALADGFGRLGFEEVLAYTAETNVRSQAVMRRSGMNHDPARDFHHPDQGDGLSLRRWVVYAATPQTWQAP